MQSQRFLLLKLDALVSQFAAGFYKPEEFNIRLNAGVQVILMIPFSKERLSFHQIQEIKLC